jgi:hypothetical protein
MLCFLPVDTSPPRLHPPSVGDHCADVFFLVGIVSWSVEVEVPPTPLLLVVDEMWSVVYRGVYPLSRLLVEVRKTTN